MSNDNDKRIFLDYAAATPVSQRSFNAYIEASQYFANPQALHTEGLEAARVRDEARSTIAKILAVKSQELVFTSGGTEANNLALAGYLLFLEEKGTAMEDCHVVISSIEHPSVGNVFSPFVSRGLKITQVSPNEHGEIKPEAIKDALQENTVLVSVALVNSEIGTVQPIHAIAKMIKNHEFSGSTAELKRAVFHTDAAQGMYQSLIPQGLGVDLLSLDSTKMYGPRGVGVLYIKHGVKISPVLRGGSQESGIRPGTENTALASGFAEALTEAAELRTVEDARLEELNRALLESLQKEIPDLIRNGDAKNQSPHILNISIPKIDAEYVAMYLDQRGISITTKSACLERSDASSSHVVKELGEKKPSPDGTAMGWRASSTLRLSFGRDTSADDIPVIVSKVRDAVEKYRSFKN